MTTCQATTNTIETLMTKDPICIDGGTTAAKLGVILRDHQQRHAAHLVRRLQPPANALGWVVRVVGVVRNQTDARDTEVVQDFGW